MVKIPLPLFGRTLLELGALFPRPMQAELISEKRKVRRVEVSIPSRIRHSGFGKGAAEAAPVKIRNLSFYGFRADGEPPVKHGDFVSIDLPKIGLVRARIAWAKDGRFGAIFSNAVDVRKCL